MKRPFWLWLVCLISIHSCNDTNTKPVAYTNHDSASVNSNVVQNDTTMSLIIQEMKNELSGEKITGDIDYDYAKMIISNDKAVVEMIKLLLSKGRDEELKKFAMGVLKVRRNRIEEITKFYITDSTHVSPWSEKFQQALKPAIAEVMPNKQAATNNIDKDFALQMIQLEKMAIIMAEAHLDYGSIQTLKIKSRGIVSKQNEDLSWLNDWLVKH